MAKSRKKRRAWNAPGHAHFLTFTCVGRRPLLTSDVVRGWMIESLQRVREEYDVAIWGYVIMPEHVHVLMFPRTPTYDISLILAETKRPVSTRFRAYLQQSGRTGLLETLTIRYPSRTVFRFWLPGGGHDRNLVHPKSVAAVLDYMHKNPIERGLVARTTDWRWSSARYWDGESGVDLAMDPFPG